MSKYLFLIASVVGNFSFAEIFEIQNRPLRTLEVGTELFVTIEGELRAGSVYQNGKAVLIGYPPFEENSPYCEVESFSSVPPFESRNTGLKLNDIEGSLFDDGKNSSWTKFITNLSFVSKNGHVHISCKSNSHGVFREISIGEFEKTFGINLRFGNLMVADPGIELNNPLYPEYYVLNANALRSALKLETKTPIKLSFEIDTGVFRSTIADGKILPENDHLGPYCQLLVRSENATANNQELVLPSDLSLKFEGDFSGGYKKMTNWDFGFFFTAELVGFEKPIQIYCNSVNSSQPLKYSGASSITKSIISWIFAY